MAGYAFGRFRFFGREVLFMAMLALLMLPGILTLIPLFILVRDLSWLDTPQAIILPWTAFQPVFATFIMRIFFERIPKEIFEAARLDGAGELRMLFVIATPLALPALGTIAIFNLLFTWNDIIWPLVALFDPGNFPVALGAIGFRSEYRTNFGHLFAAYTVAIAPLLLAFAFLVRQFFQGLKGGLSICNETHADRRRDVDAVNAWPFNPQQAKHSWVTIEADGFDDPVPGCIYDGPRLDGGVPLGGLGTGYFTLEGSGKTGFCSIYNDIVPPRRADKDWLTVHVGDRSLPLSSADIAYWATSQWRTWWRSSARCRSPSAFAPSALSSLATQPTATSPRPCSRSRSPTAATNRSRWSWPSRHPRPPTTGKAQVALSGDDVRRGDEPGTGSLAVELAPGASARQRFVFAWYAPNWRDSGNEAHVHQYGQRYADAAAVAQDAFDRFDSLLGRVLAWQAEIYRAELPAWLRDALIQGLYSLAKNTVWIAKTRKDEWWGEDGWFTHNESHTGCPITETVVCRMHGHFPALFFFPELEASTLEAFRHFQIGDGEIPFSYGMQTSMRDPRYHCQHPLNPGQYAQMIYRLYRRTGDEAQLRSFYDSTRRAIRYQFSLDDDDDGLVNDQAHVAPGELWPANQFYDIWPWWGTSAYVAGTWLATLACGIAMAEAVGDDAFVDECQDWLERGQKAYDEKLWTGSYYRLWSDPDNDQVNEVSLGNQLMAQWCVNVVGLPDVLPEDNIQAALGTVEQLNMAATPYGLVNGVTPEGERYDSKANATEGAVDILANNDHAKQTFVGETLCAAMTFLYHGRADTGLEIARRVYEALALKTASPWNQRCLIDADSGLPVWGDDYYSDMVIWAVPMALAGQSVGDFAEGGGLLDRMLEAAR